MYDNKSFERQGRKETLVHSSLHHFGFATLCIPYEKYKRCERKSLVYVVMFTPEIYILFLTFSLCQLISWSNQWKKFKLIKF